MANNDAESLYSIDLQEKVTRMLTERLTKEADEAMMQSYGLPNNKFILPESVEYEKLREMEHRKFKDAIMQDWEQLRKKDPDEQFRRQTNKDIAEIKDAIRKIGILFGEDAPSKAQMKKHKMLKDAYNKYKMIEALVLEGEK
jgi:hypothetical protein